MAQDLRWLSIFIHAMAAADTSAAADEVSAEVVGLAVGDRRSVEAARIHLITSLADDPPTHRMALALGYLDLALRRGEEAGRWHQRLVDPWHVGQSGA